MQGRRINLKWMATAGLLTTALVVAGAGEASAATAPMAFGRTVAAPSTCLPTGHDDAWPTSTDGRPGRDPGVTVWHDTSGWHVRVMHATMRDRVFSGEIATAGALVDVKAVRLEKNDALTVGPNAHTIRFRFNNYGGVDGFDFVTRCAPFLEFGFASDGHVVPTARISIGAAGRHPARDPFLIGRS